MGHGPRQDVCNRAKCRLLPSGKQVDRLGPLLTTPEREERRKSKQVTETHSFKLNVIIFMITKHNYNGYRVSLSTS